MARCCTICAPAPADASVSVVAKDMDARERVGAIDAFAEVSQRCCGIPFTLTLAVFGQRQ